MGATINYTDDILKCIWGGDTSGIKINTYYLGVSISPINKDGTGVREPNIGVGGYARLAIPNTIGADGSFVLINNTKISNAKDFSFSMFTDQLSVTGATGSLRATHWFMTDDANSTDATRIKWYGELKKSRPLEVDSVLTFAVGEMILEFEMPAI